MAPTEQLARGFTYELNTGTVSIPDWIEINHIDTWAKSSSAVDAETTTGDDDGEASHMKAERSYQLTLSGKYQEDDADGSRDPGQEAVEAWAAEMGPSSRKQFRETSPGGNTKVYMATANMSAPDGGGGKNEAGKWEVVITRSGATTADTLPALPVAPTVVAGSTADDSSLITWTDPASGSPFVDFEVVGVLSADGTTVVATHRTTTDPFHFPGLTGGTAYKFKVRARNAAGFGPFSDLSAAVTPS